MSSDWARGMHLCGNLSLGAKLCVVIKDVVMDTPTTPAVQTKVSLPMLGPSSLTSCSLPPSILSPCDNRDIPELLPCLAAGLSLNSSGVCGMLDWRAEQPGGWRRTDERKWTTLINSGLLWLLVLEAPGCPQQDGPAHERSHRPAHKRTPLHTQKRGRTSAIQYANLEQAYPYVAA